MAVKKKQVSPKKAKDDKIKPADAPASAKATAGKEGSSPASPKAMPEAREAKEQFAVIETGGKQYKVSIGDVLSVEKLSLGGKKKEYKEGDKITFDKVMLFDNGKDTTIGTPYISKAKVEATFQEEGKGKKINVIQYKSKSRYFKKKGHRQPYTKVKITSIK